VHGGLADPVLELHGVAGLITTSDDWREDSNQAGLIQASGVPPRHDLESAIVISLPPDSYTAVVRGKNGTTGIGLVEIYDLNQTADSLLANISTRGFVDSGENVMIGGFILGGSSAGSRVIIRAIGPSLRQSGVANALSDPTVELYDGNGERITLNDDWKENEQTGQSQEAEVRATTIEPTNDLEAAIIASLPAGSYTAIVRGKDGDKGVGLVEVYNLP
jgi:hypothetical protein